MVSLYSIPTLMEEFSIRVYAFILSVINGSSKNLEILYLRLILLGCSLYKQWNVPNQSNYGSNKSFLHSTCKPPFLSLLGSFSSAENNGYFENIFWRRCIVFNYWNIYATATIINIVCGWHSKHLQIHID